MLSLEQAIEEVVKRKLNSQRSAYYMEDISYKDAGINMEDAAEILSDIYEESSTDIMYKMEELGRALENF